MAPKSTQAREHAKSQLRDEKGHFIKVKVSADSPFDTESPERSRRINPEFEKPIVKVEITNPFKKILYWLDQIRRHQTTTFAIKLSIPLIALPIIIAAAFSLGRLSGLNFGKQNAATAPSPIPNTKYDIQNTVTSKAGTLKIAKSATQTRYLLSLKNGELLSLAIPANIDLSRYQNKQILVTGTYDKNSGVLTVTDIAEITVLNTLEIPSSTESAK